MTELGESLTAASAQAVYRCFSADGHLLYVGTTGNLGRRLADHAQKIWFLDVYGITLEWHPDELSALAAERRYIQIERPKYNVVYRDAGPDLKPRRQGSPSRVVTSIVPPRPPVARGQLADAKAAVMRELASAPPDGVSPKRLVEASGLSRTIVHEILSAMVQRSQAVRVGRGRYRGAA